MSHRPHIYISKRVPCDGGVSPNAFFPQVTVEIRVFYPTHQLFLANSVLQDAYEDAMTEMGNRIINYRTAMEEWRDAHPEEQHDE